MEDARHHRSVGKSDRTGGYPRRAGSLLGDPTTPWLEAPDTGLWTAVGGDAFVANRLPAIIYDGGLAFRINPKVSQVDLRSTTDAEFRQESLREWIFGRSAKESESETPRLKRSSVPLLDPNAWAKTIFFAVGKGSLRIEGSNH